MNESTTPTCPQCKAPLPAGPALGVCPRCAAALLQGAATQLSGERPPAPFTPPAIAELAPLFPQLEMLELLGTGGMGAVYKARQKELDRVVALKILPPGIGSNPAFAERFTREAKALARLNHPGIVTVYDFGHVTGLAAPAGPLYYFLMEFIDGVTLHELVEGGRIAPREALAIVPQICDALQYAHDQGIVHRDIKPANILLDRRGHVKVADFGLAKLMEPGAEPSLHASPLASNSLTQAGHIMGTPAYMAPEQAAHPEAVDHRADIYALGVVFYQMLTGELPGRQAQPPSTKVSLDVRFDAIVLRALEQEPRRRYQHISEVKTAVQTVAASDSSKTPVGAEPSSLPLTKKILSLLERPAMIAFLVGFLALFILCATPVLFLGTRGALGSAAQCILLGLWGGTLTLAFYLLQRAGWLTRLLALATFGFLCWLALGAWFINGGWVPGLLVSVLPVLFFVVAARRLSWPRRFLSSFTIVFLLVLGFGALQTALMPRSFESHARLKIEFAPARNATALDTPYELNTELETLQSGVILEAVAQELNLSEQWGKKFGRGRPLPTSDTVRLLHSCLVLRPVRNTGLIDICLVSDSPQEAATIANRIAEVYQAYRRTQRSTAGALAPVEVEIIDCAIPADNPTRPNKPLNFALAASIGLVLGLSAGALRARRKP